MLFLSKNADNIQVSHLMSKRAHTFLYASKQAGQITRKIVLLDFVNYLNYKIIKLQSFKIWNLLLSADMKGGRGQV
jgi:hypothetical protein